MNQFFRQLSATLKDRQEIRISIKKIENDLVAVVTTDFKSGTKNIEMSGTPEELDENFIAEIEKPISAISSFKSNADEVKAEIEKEEEEDNKEPAKEEKKTPKAQKSSKKQPSKKTEKPAIVHEGPEDKVAEVSLEDVPVTQPPVDKQEEPQPTPEEPVLSKKESFDKLIEEAKAAFADRKYKEAEAWYMKALEIYPENESAKKALDNASKWVRAVERMNLK